MQQSFSFRWIPTKRQKGLRRRGPLWLTASGSFHFIKSRRCSGLSTSDLEGLREGQVVLGASLAGTAAEDELGRQLPVGGDFPLGGDALVDEGVVMLEVGAEALGLEGGPGGELQDGGAVLGPGREAVLVEGELLLHGADDGGVDEEEDGAGAGLEACIAPGRGIPALGGYDGLQDVRGDVPQLVALGAVEHQHAVRLRVEGRGDLDQVLLHDRRDLVRGDGQLLVQLVEGPTGLEGLEKRGGVGSHGDGFAGRGGRGEGSSDSRGASLDKGGGQKGVGCSTGRRGGGGGGGGVES